MYVEGCERVEHLNVTVVDGWEVRMRYISPELLLDNEADKNRVPQIVVLGSCSFMWSHAAIPLGTAVHRWPEKNDTGLFETALVPVRSLPTS